MLSIILNWGARLLNSFAAALERTCYRVLCAKVEDHDSALRVHVIIPAKVVKSILLLRITNLI